MSSSALTAAPDAAIQQNSSLSTPFSVENLPPAQAQVVAALAQGHSITQAAAEAGVHRTTVHHWRRTSHEFRVALSRARRHFAATLSDDLRDLSATALETVRAMLAAPDTPPAVRLKAALAVLERPAFAGWQLPEDIRPPFERELMDGIAALEAQDRAFRRAAAQAREGERISTNQAVRI